MMETQAINVDEEPKGQKTSELDRSGKPQKRKRASLATEPPKPEERAVKIKALRAELDGLFRYYKELKENRMPFDLDNCRSSNAAVAALMEESELPLSKLVEEIYDKRKGNGLTLASVKNSVLFLGQRVMYGVPNAEADVLEDESGTCLWCWETRDMKLIPKSLRVTLNLRRTCRKKIHERIIAVSGMITALQKLEADKNYEINLTKALEKLAKVHNEADVRSYMDKLLQKNGAEMAEKEAKREEKLLIKELEKNKREAEKEKKKMERELQKERGQMQEEAEKDQRRREKEEAEQKKQLSIQKQASIMERFLKRSKTSPSCKNEPSLAKATSDWSNEKCGSMFDAVTLSMDSALSAHNEINSDELRKLHLLSWQRLGHSIHLNKKQRWGIRQRPKSELFTKLKLSTNRELANEDFGMDKLVCGWAECTSDEKSHHSNADSSVRNVSKCNRGKQLFQFDKSHRPAFYGIWVRKSCVVGPRHPFKKDPDIDYEEDSDEEWEEEDPGESLSDCDKDEEEESLEEGCLRGDDEDESEDGFFVPDGYLSENEGIQVDRMETDVAAEARSSPNCKQESTSDEFCLLLQQQKCLNNLTEHALRKNQPMIILNFTHEKSALLVAEDLTGTTKLERMCLKALSMRVFPDGSTVDISIENIQDQDQEACLSGGKGSSTPISTMNAITESDLPTIVSAIHSSPQGISKVVESLQQKFPAASKSQLRSKVREISDFVDNRWQVKKEILDKHGLLISPGNLHPPIGWCIIMSSCTFK